MGDELAQSALFEMAQAPEDPEDSTSLPASAQVKVKKEETDSIDQGTCTSTKKGARAEAKSKSKAKAKARSEKGMSRPKLPLARRGRPTKQDAQTQEAADLNAKVKVKKEAVKKEP